MKNIQKLSLVKLLLLGILKHFASGAVSYMNRPVEIGKNDVGRCDTKATTFDFFEKDTSTSPAYMRILIGGTTNSKKVIYSQYSQPGATTDNGCLVRFVPFILECLPMSIDESCNDTYPDALNWTFFGH